MRGEINLGKVDFAYRPDVPVLRGVDLDVPAGQTVALVGATGAGKTTIAKLISRFYDPTGGTGAPSTGVDLRTVEDLELRRAGRHGPPRTASCSRARSPTTSVSDA